MDEKITEQYCNKLAENGLVIIENAIDIGELYSLEEQYTKSWQDIKSKWNLLEWKTIKVKPNVQNKLGFIGIELYRDKKLAVFEDDYCTINVLDMGNNRYDFTYGFEHMKLQSPIVNNIMQQMLKFEFEHYLGCLPVESVNDTNSIGNGTWHRDAYSLFDNETFDMQLKPFYYTVLIPLEDICNSSISTEFIIGSHKDNLTEKGVTDGCLLTQWCDSIGKDKKIKITCKRGDAIVFNGYTLHRGVFGDGKKRDMIYAVFKKNWYNDEPTENYDLV